MWWYRGKWHVSKEIASIFIEFLYKITQRGIEIINEEDEFLEFFSYHPLEKWEEEKKSIETHAILLQALFADIIIDCEWELIEEKKWKTHFKSCRINPNLIVLPASWPYTPKMDEIAIWIKPGMAFGTGMHETTQLCLKAMYKLYAKEHPKTLLDVGTGTGILAILGEKLGIKEILALDIDPLAIAAAKENFKLNKIKNIKLIHGNIKKINQSFDWVVANLETKIIISLAQELKKLYQKSLILSGILKNEIEQVKKAICLPYREVMIQGEWVCLIF